MLKEFMLTNPKLSIVLLAIAATFFITLIQKYFTDQKRIKELKKIQKQYQKDMRELKGDIKKQAEINAEVMKLTGELFKHMMKPMLYTTAPMLFLFWWAKQIFVLSTLGSGWLWWYLGASIVSSMIIRKVLDVA